MSPARRAIRATTATCIAAATIVFALLVVPLSFFVAAPVAAGTAYLVARFGMRPIHRAIATARPR